VHLFKSIPTFLSHTRQDRLSKVDNYDQEPGLGIPAGVNILPKPTYMCTYSCRTSENMLLDFQKEILGKFMESFPELYGGQFINVDFHSIPHHGSESEMEKIWCGSKHKTMKGANTVFAQDSKSKMIIYTRADILRKEEAEEIKKFVAHWQALKGDVSETLVFDCKLRKYATDYQAVVTEFLGKIKEHPIDESHPFIIRDQNKCISCARCIRTCLDIKGIGALGFVYRGFNVEVSPPPQPSKIRN